MYDTKKYNSQYFYIGSWIYKTILHKNFFFFFFLLTIHVDKSLSNLYCHK